ncbi:hypothetical protein ACCO45_011075 [Purpureocillium lilacinum]|uniref:Uncharacterized protein n=1 Tax=Purpureocillium lilacinum TaxID=33203 RepID=A0ACC4DH93_PURLI
MQLLGSSDRVQASFSRPGSSIIAQLSRTTTASPAPGAAIIAGAGTCLQHYVSAARLNCPANTSADYPLRESRTLLIPCAESRERRGIMPPHLHPRSRMTSSLFATTVVASFFVVALPHILPCPVPRTKFADGEVIVDENGRRRRWRRRDPAESKDGIVQFNQTGDDDTYTNVERTTRECPVPKPGGMLGEWLGFHKSDGETGKR